jgi:sporulation protein YlmC with PRC-barrel domain
LFLAAGTPHFDRRSIEAIHMEDYKMRSSFVTAALLGATVLGSAAYAQSTQPSPPATTAAPAASATATPSGQKMMLKGNWRASKLMGLDVYNEANEKLGDINELILDKDGKINAVVIGVGGFLGMGEHDIAVSIDKLKFVEEAVRTSSTAPATTTERRETTTGAATSPATTAPAATTTTTTTTSARATTTNDWVPDHAVMSGTKDQLKAMPQFKYSDYN